MGSNREGPRGAYRVLEGCIQTTVVGDTVEVVGLLFLLSSYFCQVADLSFMTNPNGLHLDGPGTRAENKHARFVF